MHANWAFSEPGRYVLRVRADAAIAGTPVTDTADYVFHVGELDLATPTTLAVAVPQVRFGRAADLVARITPEAATGAVSVRVGSKTVTSSLSAGKARLKLPARSLKPGEHHLEIRYAGVAGIYAPTVAPVTVHVVKAKPTVRAKAPDTASRGSRVTLTVTVTAPGLKPAGKAKVKIAGLKAKTVKVLGGRASVTFTIAKSAKKSTRNVAVSYLGTKEIAKGDAKKLKLKIR
ncbi:MAG: Ig-like domain repeat protein [Nocardioidaceae bacterium]|nr:MAG: Ig-like domain repeat protein [Nocardioidaceae bacterium]